VCPQISRAAEVKVAGKPWTVLTLSPAGKHPDLKVEGNTLVAGNQRVSFDGKNVTLAVFRPRENYLVLDTIELLATLQPRKKGG
jgi:hypothetical protein